MSVGHAACDAVSVQCAETGKNAKHPRLVIATTILASSLAFIDGSVVNVALPAIGASLKAETAGLQRVVNAYLLALSALLLLGVAAAIGAALCAGASLSAFLLVRQAPMAK